MAFDDNVMPIFADSRVLFRYTDNLPEFCLRKQ